MAGDDSLERPRDRAFQRFHHADPRRGDGRERWGLELVQGSIHLLERRDARQVSLVWVPVKRKGAFKPFSPLKKCDKG